MKKKPDPVDVFFSKLFKSITFYVSLSVVVAALIIWKSLPSWEEKNSRRINEQIVSINHEIEISPVKAWSMWEELEKEIKGKNIKSRTLKASISELKISMNELYPEIQDELDRIDEERRREADELLVAENERRMIQAQEEARDQLRKKYRNISQDAKDAVASLKKLEAYTEVGVNKLKYQEALGVAWGDIKVFVESAEARENYPELSKLLAEAIQEYKEAADVWGSNNKDTLQLHWQLGALKIKEIDYLVNQ